MDVVKDRPHVYPPFERYGKPYAPHYDLGRGKKEKTMAFCVFNIDRFGNVECDYLSKDKGHRKVHIETEHDFMEMLSWSTHTFTCAGKMEIDACINKFPNEAFKTNLCAYGRAFDVRYGSFFRNPHKLNVQNGNTWHHLLDISDLSRKGSYALEPLGSAEEVRAFTLVFMGWCIKNGVVFGNNLTWATISNNWVMKHVNALHFPFWDDPQEELYQTQFYRWCKGPHHGARVLGTFTGANYDRIRCHLNIMKSLPSHSKLYCDYIKSKHFNPDALYALYFIVAKLPKLPFEPWVVRLAKDFAPEVYGDQWVAVMQPNLKAAVEVLGLKEGKDFIVKDSYQIVPRKGKDIVYPYYFGCKKLERVVDSAPKGVYAKSISHRFAGMMHHVMSIYDWHHDSIIIPSSTFDPLISSTIWATEYAQNWITLMGSVRPQLLRVDGGTAGIPNVDLSLYTLEEPGQMLSFNHQLKDRPGETKFRNLIREQRDKPSLTYELDSMLGFVEAISTHTPYSEVGKTFSRTVPIVPGDSGRMHREIKNVCELLEGEIITEVLSGDEAMARAEEKQTLGTQMLFDTGRVTIG